MKRTIDDRSNERRDIPKHYCCKCYAKKDNEPEQTKAEYCSYDKAHKDYLYTQAWVNFLIEKMGHDDEYAMLYEKL